MSFIERLIETLKEACEPMEEKKIITLGDVLDLLDEDRESDEEIIVHDKDDNEVSGPMCSELWKPHEDRRVDAIGAKINSLEIWLED